VASRPTAVQKLVAGSAAGAGAAIAAAHPRLTTDGKTVVYLDPAGNQLDIVAVDLVTMSKRTLVASPDHERGFVLGKL
jgi:hypothetical protein